MGLGGCWLAGYYLAYDTPRLFKWDNLALLCCFFFGIIYVPMYSTCLPTYLRAYLPIMCNSLLY
jgi:hypothetical protein